MPFPNSVQVGAPLFGGLSSSSRDIFTREESIAAQRIFAKRLQEWVITQAAATGGLEGVLAKIGRDGPLAKGVHKWTSWRPSMPS